MKNWFTSKPYWLKGGIIGFIVGIFLSVLSFLCLSIFEAEAGLICLFLIWPGTLFIFSFIDFSNEAVAIWMMHIPHLIFWFALGSIVGWVVGKFKRRKQTF